MARTIKTRDSIRSIKLRNGTEYFSEKTQDGLSSLKETAEETHNSSYQSETEYAGDQVMNREKAVAKGFMRASEDIGDWGVKETSHNIYKWYKSRKAKKATTNATKASRKMIKEGRKGIKRLGNTAKSSAKATAKGTIKIAHKIKQAITTLIKNAKIIIKAVIAAAKAIIAAIKAIGAAIAAGGWVAVVVIIVICLVAVIGSSAYGIFTPEMENENVIAQMMGELDEEYVKRQEEMAAEYEYDELIYEGDTAAWREVVAVYAVKINLASEAPRDLVTFDESKSDVLKSVYSSMNSIKIETEVRESEDGGENKTVVTVRVIREHLTAYEAADEFDFTEQQKEMLDELLHEKNNELWQGLFASAY